MKRGCGWIPLCCCRSTAVLAESPASGGSKIPSVPSFTPNPVQNASHSRDETLTEWRPEQPGGRGQPVSRSAPRFTVSSLLHKRRCQRWRLTGTRILLWMRTVLKVAKQNHCFRTAKLHFHEGVYGLYICTSSQMLHTRPRYGAKIQILH